MPAESKLAENFTSFLKHSTSSKHQKLESGSLSRFLLSDDVSFDDYRKYLLKMKDIVCFYEDAIFPVLGDVIPGIEARRKFDLIKNDLEFLGTNQHNTNTAFQAIKVNIAIPTALGYMYVLEGSTLGGRIILKHLSSKLNISAEKGGMFFAGYKTETGIYWKQFLQILNEYVEKNDCADEIVEGANHAFDSIYNHFEQQII